ncbi:glycosyltransferase [Candidatus Dojkabacteria bacterium]|uniref:Glycosyltransferase n=1 Tax=Candidatus Dojkabacteria bacterium TaxID=2099670 RepID=A0A955IA08_9BACT|nr:glycosyltransferase [Candidatus Dojkabacteria bacterium]MCB0748257.1 glycosyltransferase [Ignavibacteriota bacterium]
MKISVLIPVYNEEKAIGKLLDSIMGIDYPKEDFEIVVVNDGSTDKTSDVVKKYKNVRLVNHPKNLGRFDARKTAMNEAKHENLLYIDSRCLVPKEILRNLKDKKDNVIIGHSKGLKKETIFEVFYSAIRRQFFRKYYRECKQRIILTKENFDIYPKGTTIFFIKRPLLKQIIETYGHTFNRESSEDTRLFSYILEKDNIVIDPDIWIINYGRDDTNKSLHHVIERGLHFTDYYLKKKSLKHWMILLFPVFALAGIYLLWWLFGITSLILMGISWLMVSVYLDHVPSRSIKIFLIGPILALLYYLGILKGLYKLLIKNSPKQFLALLFTLLILLGAGYYLYENHSDFKIILDLKYWQVIILAGFNMVLLSINGLFSWYLYRQFGVNLGKIESIALATATSFGNTFLPFRAGMGGSAVYLKKKHDLRYSSFATIVAGSYIINFFVLGILGLISMLIIYLKTSEFSIVVALAFTCLSVGSILSIFSTKLITKLIPFKGLKEKVLSVVEGWNIISKSPKRVAIMSLITALNLIVIATLLYSQFIFLGIVKTTGEIIDIWDNIFLSSFSVLSIFLNITPSALGIKELLFAFASQVINIRAQDAVVASVLDRIVGATLLLIIGPLSIFFLKRLGMIRKIIKK